MEDERAGESALSFDNAPELRVMTTGSHDRL